MALVSNICKHLPTLFFTDAIHKTDENHEQTTKTEIENNNNDYKKGDNDHRRDNNDDNNKYNQPFASKQTFDGECYLSLLFSLLFA